MNQEHLELLYKDIEDLQSRLLKYSIDNDKKKEAKETKHLLRQKISNLEELHNANEIIKKVKNEHPKT